ncbi:hypothetical protein, partial [Actinotalea ferrariae]|uniref:hypothetical protein n=1 Tax=Actinotalea ferrariae TaxID=1386098 RepID=UPI000553E3DA
MTLVRVDDRGEVRVSSARDYRSGVSGGRSAAAAQGSGPCDTNWKASGVDEAGVLVTDLELKLSEHGASRDVNGDQRERAVPRQEVRPAQTGVPVADPFPMFGQSLFTVEEPVDTASDVWGDDDADEDGNIDDAHLGEDPDLDAVDWPFGDLEELVPGLFSIWAGGSEDRWAAYAWAALQRAGLTHFDDEVERTLVICRLLVLAALNREFASRAHEEGGLSPDPG